ncbi:hypothetical protein SAMN05428988_3167 [Chitinophaga sp. YR573]|uniref:hypothetical protein n=1 Tax=Chitinophaga sp. YR573 TaxID=1881040 RepID=UPI0008C4DD21|nr:hypothetical protein [Chitinophaga sp. YR573]SEW21062.1 hypothetical protein SAMN05428988_3167 [Chitinophaga sp. YR573]
MEPEVIHGLSMSDFGEFIKTQINDDNSFGYALLRYGSEAVMITSEQWYKFCSEGNVIPGSISVKKDYQRTYKLDANKQREKDENGDFILIQKEKRGWQMIGAKSLTQVKTEALIEGEIAALSIDKEVIVQRSRNKLAELQSEAAKFSVLSDDTIARIKAQLALDADDDDDDDQEEEQKDPNLEANTVGGQQVAATTADQPQG